jgi:hypothetical protein
MDVSGIKTVGEIAGAGGAILFLVILFFRNVLNSKISERLGRRQANFTVNLMIWGVLSLAFFGGTIAFLSQNKAAECSTSPGNVTIQGDQNASISNTGCGNQNVSGFRSGAK